jgi:hypothetical protein
MDGDLCSHLSLKERKKIRKRKNIKKKIEHERNDKGKK